MKVNAGKRSSLMVDKLIPVCSDEATLIISVICLGRMYSYLTLSFCARLAIFKTLIVIELIIFHASLLEGNLGQLSSNRERFLGYK